MFSTSSQNASYIALTIISPSTPFINGQHGSSTHSEGERETKLPLGLQLSGSESKKQQDGEHIQRQF
jgi:hypothetical protein